MLNKTIAMEVTAWGDFIVELNFHAVNTFFAA
jgi:hypothetical protein